MHLSEFTSRVDHTILGPETVESLVEQVLTEAIAEGMNVCIPPSHISFATNYLNKKDADVDIVTVVGFPNGQSTIESKIHEAKDAYQEGADEIDFVLNIGRLKQGDTEYIENELEAVSESTPLPTKTIICTPLLTDEEKETAARLVGESPADYVKTATGFHGGGATIPDVELLSQHENVKASGGIGSYEEAKVMFEAGASRIGASSGVDIVQGHPEHE